MNPIMIEVQDNGKYCMINASKIVKIEPWFMADDTGTDDFYADARARIYLDDGDVIEAWDSLEQVNEQIYTEIAYHGELMRRYENGGE